MPAIVVAVAVGDEERGLQVMLSGQYGVILADPPWQFDNWSEAGTHKGAAAQYDCMSLDAICNLRVTLGMDFLCKPDAVLVMWACFPMLPEAFKLMSAWGFQYKAGGAWAKTTSTGKQAFGTGYIYRSAAEPWLLGVRGKPKRLAANIRNCIVAPTRGHSRKPDRMYEMIESQWLGPYLELFARSRRHGWDVFGNETDKFEAVA